MDSLTGIPCKHAVTTNCSMTLNGASVELPENGCILYTGLSTWKESYNFNIERINGSMFWHSSGCPTTLVPPTHHKQIGRPKKKRKKTSEETSQRSGKTGKLPRTGKTFTCDKCKNPDHNSRTYKGQGA